MTDRSASSAFNRSVPDAATIDDLNEIQSRNPDQNEWLNYAAATNKLDAYIYLAEQGLDVHAFRMNNHLLWAVSHAANDVALWIAESSRNLGIDLNVQDRCPWDSSKRRRENQDLPPVWDMLDQRLGAIDGPYLRNTGLLLAVKKGWDYADTHRDKRPASVNMGRIIAALLENDADPDIQDACGNAALHIAILQRDLQSIGALLKHGARQDIRNNAGQLPLDMLDIPYNDINPFLYIQTGNEQCCANTHFYIHTLQDKESWERARDSVMALASSYEQAPRLHPSPPAQQPPIPARGAGPAPH
jgi:hypothetical protein